MGDQQPELARVVHRGRDSAWLQQAQHKRRRRRRRGLWLTAAVTVAVLTAGFFINDGPRRSGILDASGLTCGEFVADSAANQERVFEPWDAHAATLEAAAEVHDDDGEFDWQVFVEDVESAAAQLEAEPLHAVFTGWTPGQRKLSAAAVGGELLIGHHQQMWTITEAVSVADPETGQAQWRAELEHPQREDWQNPERVLYGVGAFGNQVVLQTPAVNGDTDVVTFDAEDDWSQDCVRLAGAVDPVEVLQEQPRAWPVVMNLNWGRSGDSSFLALHGLGSEQGPGHLVSEIEVASGEAEPAGEYEQVYPPDSGYGPTEESLEVAEDFNQLAIDELQPVGEAHYLLTWDAGAVILQRR